MKNLLILLFSVFAVTVQAQVSVGTSPRISKDSTAKGYVAISKKVGNNYVQNTMRLDSMLMLAKDSIVFSAGDFTGGGIAASPVTLKGKVDTLYKNGTADSLIYYIAGRRYAIAFPASVGGSGGTLYGTTGTNTDGPMTQAATTNTLNQKAPLSLTLNDQTASYTLVLSDAGKLIRQNVASANNVNVPQNSSVAFPIGTQITVSNTGAGQVTFVPLSTVVINSAGGALKLRVQYSVGTLIKTGTDTWLLTGDITP